MVFRKIFGKPTYSDCINKYLACQKINGETTINSLTTKRKFNDTEDYNQAFYRLIEHFKTASPKELVCSPMGCIRDKISLTQFAVVRFQDITKAKISIVTYYESTVNPMRDRHSYNNFVTQLKKTLHEEYNNYPADKLYAANYNDNTANPPNLEIDRTTRNSSTVFLLYQSAVLMKWHMGNMLKVI